MGSDGQAVGGSVLRFHSAIACVNQSYLYKEGTGSDMFNFRIITTAEGLEIIDRTLTTSSDLLNPFELMDYVALEDTLAFMDRKRRISRKRSRRKRKLARNPLYRLLGIIGLI